MALVFQSIATFRYAVANLCKKPVDGYTSCKADIHKCFEGLTFPDIWEKHYLIRSAGDIRIIKVRLPQNTRGKSKNMAMP